MKCMTCDNCIPYGVHVCAECRKKGETPLWIKVTFVLALISIPVIWGIVKFLAMVKYISS